MRIPRALSAAFTSTFTALSAAAFIGALAATPAAAQTTWDLPNAYPPANYHTENIVQFAKDVEAATGGKLKITVHSNASLFKAPEIKRAVQSGQAQAGEILLANYGNENPIYSLDGVPFLATTYDEARKLYDVSRPTMEKLLAAQGIKVLFVVPWAPQGIFIKKPVESAADLKGVKWRAYSPATARIAELVNAQPVQIQQAELSAAMATGAIEAYMSSGSTGFDTKTYESLKFYYDTQAWIPKNAVLVNVKALDALDAATRDALLKAAANAETRGWKIAQEKNSEYKRLLAEHGMKVEKPSAKLDADMRQVGATMQADWLKLAGPEGAAIVETYRKK
jgi:TRAP-type C4-dicarboxylate transport system substrate-binding protein